MLWRNNSGAVSNAFSVANNVATGTGRALFGVSTETQLGLISPSVASYSSLTLAVASGHVSVDTTPAGTFRPLTDIKTPLGDSTHRWNNVHLQLPVQAGYYGGAGHAPPPAGFPYLVTGDAADATRLGYFCGVTNYLLVTVTVDSCATLRAELLFQCGVITRMTCV
jgi:hypothetical protein